MDCCWKCVFTLLLCDLSFIFIGKILADGSFNTLMTVPFIEELQRWVESFGLCPNVEIDENCFTLSNTAPPQKHELSDIRNVVSFCVFALLFSFE